MTTCGLRSITAPRGLTMKRSVRRTRTVQPHDTAMQQRLARRDREWSLNDGQTPNPDVVRVALGTGYHRVEGNRRASRFGP